MKVKRTVILFLFLLLLIAGVTGCNQQKDEKRREDAYYFDSDVPLESVNDGYIIHDVVLGNSEVFEFASYSNSDSAGYEYKLNIFDACGKSVCMEWKCEEGNAVKGVGPIAGSGGFVVVEGKYSTAEEQEEEWGLTRYDGNCTKSETIDVSEAFRNYPLAESAKLYEDKSGMIHAALYSSDSGTSDYKILSKDGKIIYVLSLEQSLFVKFIPMSDGRIAFETKRPTGANATEQFHHEIKLYNEQTGKIESLFEYDEIAKDGTGPIMAAGITGDKNVFYAVGSGLYSTDFSFKESVLISSFEDQGFMSKPAVLDIRENEDGFFVLMERVTDKAHCFLRHYSKAPENVRLIELALNMDSGADIYSEAIVEFNKAHSDVKIVTRTDYDSTALNTKLIAGDGPVLVDSSIVSFTQNKEMWEPLESVYEKAGATDQLNDVVKSLVSVDGVIYAVSADYCIETMVSAVADDNLTYRGLLKQLESNQDIKYLMDNELVPDVPVWIMVRVFSFDEEDSFYIDKITGKTNFLSNDFSEMLRCVDKLIARGTDVRYFEGLESGEVFYNFVAINTPEDLFFWNEMDNQGIRIVGIPKMAGAKNEIRASHILAVRKTASKEDKEAAAEFLQMILSKEVQLKMASGPNFHLSVRRDVLNEQIHAVKKNERISMSFFTTGREFSLESPKYENVEVFAEALLNNSVARSYAVLQFEEILCEEFESYFDEKITDEMLSDYLTRRIELYLSETK